MNSKPVQVVPGSSAMLVRFLAILACSYLLVEAIEVIYERLAAADRLVSTEIVEFVALVAILFCLLSRFVVAPLQKEMALRLASEARLQQSEQKNQLIIESLPDSILHVTADGTVIDFRPSANKFVSFAPGEQVFAALPPEALVGFFTNLNATLLTGATHAVDLVCKRESESSYQVFNFVKAADNEALVFIRDITNRKIYEEKLEHLSSHDVLTGLYNRTFYEAEIERLATSRRYPVSIIIVDLDGLKKINDSYGHAAGDRMICRAAEILRTSFRAEDLVARTGGDEFTVLLPETGAAGLEASLERIHRCLEEANNAADGFEVRFSMGTAIAETKEKLVKTISLADMRMYKNKSERKKNPAWTSQPPATA